MRSSNLNPSDATLPYWRDRRRIPGAFEDIDFLLFDHLLAQQVLHQQVGDVLEIGAFNGKSAIVLGSHIRADDRLIVCDVFEHEGVDAANNEENEESYGGLSRQHFLANYQRYVTTNTPVIVQEFSENIRKHVPDGSLRFAHIDGGHLYDVVRNDIANLQHTLNADGIAAFDDYRAFHTPGVGAAVWQAVGGQALVPICMTDAKLYCTWSTETAGRTVEMVDRWLARNPGVRSGRQRIAGVEVTLIANPRIWTRRRALKAAIPPLVAEKILRRPASYLGS